MPNRPPIVTVIVFLILAAATISGAWGFQLIGGYIPCKLCLEQRDPYYIALPMAALALAGLVFSWPRPVCAVLLLAAGGAMAYGAGLGVYQSGAEWGFWTGPTDCGDGSGAGPASVTDLMSQLKTARIVSCTEASWRLFGLSFAGWNAVASTALTVIAWLAALQMVRRESPQTV